MFGLFKKPIDAEREFRDWVIAERLRALSGNTYPETKALIDSYKLSLLIEETASSLNTEAQSAELLTTLIGGVRADHPKNSQSHSEGMRKLQTLLKKQGWALAIRPDVQWNGGITVVEVATGKPPSG